MQRFCSICNAILVKRYIREIKTTGDEDVVLYCEQCKEITTIPDGTLLYETAAPNVKPIISANDNLAARTIIPLNSSKIEAILIPDTGIFPVLSQRNEKL